MTVKALPRGRLRFPVVIEEREQTLDEYGHKSSTWSTFATRKAAIEMLSGTELERARSLYADATYMIRMDHVPGATDAMRIKMRNRTFEIGVVDDLELAGVVDEMLCAEVK